jgi:DNA-binding CsgD family transcriptional regulator/BMFP domain-containing protein YqiC
LFFSIVYNFYSQNLIISSGDEWEYYDKKEAPFKEWKTKPELIDSWAKGPSPLGYGSSLINTEISYGNDKNEKHITAYFKKTFRIENPLDCIAYKLGIVKDDGAVIYLNGREIMRINMPEGIIDNSTKASNVTGSTEAERYQYTKILTSDDFNAGINILAASVHQALGVSSDIIFGLELTCENNSEMLPQLLREQTLKNITLDYKIKELENKLGNEKKDIQIKSLKKGRQNYKNSLIIVFLLWLAVLIIVIYKNKNKKYTLRQNNIDLKSTNLNNNQELMSYSLQSLQNQQLFKEIKNSLEEAVNEDSASLKKEVKKLIRQIDFNIDKDDDWLKLLNHFNAVNNGYLDRLSSSHNSLSESELRHCVFIKLYMQTKEIAKILNIDPRSVQAARYRIKKKMNLLETEDLRNYLQDF